MILLRPLPKTFDYIYLLDYDFPNKYLLASISLVVRLAGLPGDVEDGRLVALAGEPTLFSIVPLL